jgi:mannan endo-1,4-beta-mannosidase
MIAKPWYSFTFLIIICCLNLSCRTTSKAGSEDHFREPKDALINYLQKVIADSMVISGQHCGNGNATAQGYEAYVEGLFQKTGQYPGLIGLEYGYSGGNDLSLINSYAVKHSLAGGIVTVTWHADNPWVDGYNCRWNSVENRQVIHFSELLKDAPESEAKSGYRTELMNVGHALAELRDAGVVVFWRPFHEMNGNWFWWGPDNVKEPTNKEDYVLLWKDMYETFTSDLGLNNLIWIYSPMLKAEWTSELNAFYPGDDMVDLVGVDIYSTIPEFNDYEALKKMGKPIVIGEIGPVKESYGKYDALDVLHALRGKAAWFLQWSSWTNAQVAIVDNPNAAEMMNHPATVTLGRIKASLEN